MANQAANGFQTGFRVFPTVAAVSSSGVRPIRFNAFSGLLGGVGVTWALSGTPKGSIDASGLYTPPSSVTAAATDQVLATAADGSQAQALISLFP